MYVNTIARSLGDPMMASGVPMPTKARLAELSKSCAAQWKSYQQAHGKNFPHRWRAFLAANPSCRAGVSIRWGYQPPLNPCGDANSGLLIDCWNQALQQGASLGALTQAQLSAASKYYAGLPIAQRRALRTPKGFVFNGTRMVRPSALGQDDSIDFTSYNDITTMPIDTVPTDYSSGVGPLTTEPAYSPSSGALPLWNEALPTSGPVNPIWGYSGSSSGYQPTSASPWASLTASIAQVIAGATGQATAPGVAKPTALQTSTLIPGIPNVIIYGGAAFLLLAMVLGNSRRR